MPESQNQSLDSLGATEDTSDSQLPTPSSDCLKSVSLSKEVDSASSQKLEDQTDSKPEKDTVNQQSEQDTLMYQHLETRHAVPVPAVAMVPKESLSPSVAMRQSNSDEEEKRDQSKEEPPLDLNQQEGQTSVHN